MTELKTLKDLFISGTDKKIVKKEAIKWVKEDLGEQSVGFDRPSPFLRRWMKRLNITEEDLK